MDDTCSSHRSALEAVQFAMAKVDDRLLQEDSECQRLIRLCDGDIPRICEWRKSAARDEVAQQHDGAQALAALNTKLADLSLERKRLQQRLAAIDQESASVLQETRRVTVRQE